uniref:Methanethiol oxidase n=1 Tax=Paramoeba aestuarina TaxID=180227 RepID=A0A7S4PHK3_9EUKA
MGFSFRMTARMERSSLLCLGLLIAMSFLSLSVSGQNDDDDKNDYICVCMRGNASTWIFDTSTDTAVRKINHANYDDADVLPVPMYCDYYEDKKGTKILSVGDRANKVVWMLDVEDDFKVIGQLKVGVGIFHHWVSEEANQVWVVCDGITPPEGETPLSSGEVNVWVFDATSFKELEVIPFPEDLLEQNINSQGTLHDVTVSPSGDFAIVTTTNLPGLNDYALKYSTDNFKETGRTAVGSAPHVTYLNESLPLYVISQNSLLDSISLIDPKTMEIQSSIPGLQGAHMMVGPGLDGTTYYVTNLPSGGVNGLFGFDTIRGQVDYTAVTDTVYTVPHNVAVSGDRRKLYLTHSGPNVEVSVWDVSNVFNPRPSFLRVIIAELNPYGIENFQTSEKICCADSESQEGDGSGAERLLLNSWVLLLVWLVVVFY